MSFQYSASSLQNLYTQIVHGELSKNHTQTILQISIHEGKQGRINPMNLKIINQTLSLLIRDFSFKNLSILELHQTSICNLEWIANLNAESLKTVNFQMNLFASCKALIKTNFNSLNELKLCQNPIKDIKPLTRFMTKNVSIMFLRASECSSVQIDPITSTKFKFEVPNIIWFVWKNAKPTEIKSSQRLVSRERALFESSVKQF